MKIFILVVTMLAAGGKLYAQAPPDKNVSIACLLNGADHTNPAHYIGTVKNGDVVSFAVTNATEKKQYAVDSFTVRYVVKAANTTKQQIQEYSKPRGFQFAKDSNMQVNAADLGLPNGVKVMIRLGRVYEVSAGAKKYVTVHHGKKEFTFDYHR
ncbi:MAG TPA: hypothetical protein VEY71_01420 [Chitinophagales bacterium]|nr:hypothetical protein [Chitinophagales bacterium]